MTDTIVLIGRGESASRYEHPGPFPRMAVSSGIFKVPRAYPPEHFVTMDAIKYFLAGLWPGVPQTWSADEKANHWPFWSKHDVTKHILSGYVDQCCTYRDLPEQVWDVVPDHAMEAFRRSLFSSQHQFGFQPTWGDFSGIQGWRVDRHERPNFTDPEAPIGLEGLNNSLLMAVQVAHLLGFKRLLFAGVDLSAPHLAECLAKMRDWWVNHLPDDCTWATLAAESQLGDFLPHVTVDCMELCA